MLHIAKPDGIFAYELEPHEVSFLGQFIQGLSARAIYDGNTAAQGIKQAVEPFRMHPDIVNIEVQLRNLKTLVDMKASITPFPEIAALKADIAALNDRLNDLIPNYGAF